MCMFVKEMVVVKGWNINVINKFGVVGVMVIKFVFGK